MLEGTKMMLMRRDKQDANCHHKHFSELTVGDVMCDFEPEVLE